MGRHWWRSRRTGRLPRQRRCMVLADIDMQLLGGSGGAASVSVASGGELSLVRVEVESGGDVSFSGSVSMAECVLTGVDVVGSTATAALSVLGGTLTSSAVSLSGGSAVLGSSCTLVNSPVSIAACTLGLSACELQSDGSTVPLTVESGGSATVTGVTFRSSAGDITAVSVSDGGSLNVSDSQLVGADGSSDPFPCDGTLPTCVEAHASPVVVDGLAAITLASPLVCDVGTGECLADVCLARGEVCAEEAPAWPVAGSCIQGRCVCEPSVGQDMATVGQWAASSSGGNLHVCLAGDAVTAVGTPCQNAGCSSTVTIAVGELALDCGKLDAGTFCTVLDRLEIGASGGWPSGWSPQDHPNTATVSLHRLRFAGMTTGTGGQGGAISAKGPQPVTIFAVECVFDGNHAGDCGGAISLEESATTLTFASSTFTANTAQNNGPAISWYGADACRAGTSCRADRTNYLNSEANAAFGTPCLPSGESCVFGQCVDDGCVCSSGDSERLYLSSFSGPACSTPPAGRECCSTWCENFRNCGPCNTDTGSLGSCLQGASTGHDCDSSC